MQHDLLLLTMAVPAVSGAEVIVHESTAMMSSTVSTYIFDLPKCVLMLMVMLMMIFAAYRLAVARGRYLGRAEAEQEMLEAKAKAEAETNKEETDDQAPELTQRKKHVEQEEIYCAPLRGGRWHIHKGCGGLREAKEIKKLTPCATCARHLAVGPMRG